MRTKLKLIAILVAVLAVFANHATAQGLERRTKLSVEIDPVTFGFGGYSLHIRVQPKNSEHLFLGAGTYAMNMPDVLVGMNADNRGKGWTQRLNQGYGAFFEYHFATVNRKWFVGGQASVQQFKISKAEVAGNAKYTNGLVMAYGGYAFQPFDFPLYFKPWAGLGYTAKVSGSNSLGGSEFSISPISMFATLHIGYTF